MGAEESTTFAYCNKDAIVQDDVSKEVDRREQALTTKHQKDGSKEVKEHEELESELDSAYTEIQHITSKKNSINMQYLRLEEDYHRESTEKTKLMDQLEKSTRRYDAMINSQKLLEEQYETELEQYKASNARFKDTQTENESLLNINKELESEVQKLTRIIAEYKSNPDDDDGNTDKNDERYKSEIEQINAANASLQQQVNQLQNTLNGKKNLEEEVAKLTRVIEEYKANNTAADGTNNEKSIEMIELEQENQSLTNELQVLKMDLMQNQQTIALLNQQLLVAQNQITAQPQVTAELQVIANGEPKNKQVMSHETDLSETQVWKTLDESELADVDSFVRDRYGTVDKGKNYDANVEDDSDDSSLSEQEKLEIAKRKGMNDEEVQQMQNEIIETQKQMRAKQLSTIDDGDEEDDSSVDTKSKAEPGNLFRYKSKANWDKNALVSQKQAMKQAMINLLQQQNEMNENMVTIQEET